MYSLCIPSTSRSIVDVCCNTCIRCLDATVPYVRLDKYCSDSKHTRSPWLPTPWIRLYYSKIQQISVSSWNWPLKSSRRSEARVAANTGKHAKPCTYIGIGLAWYYDMYGRVHLKYAASKVTAEQHHLVGMPSKGSLSVFVKTHRVVDAVKVAVLVGYRRPNAHPRPCCIRNRVAGDNGVVCMTGDTCGTIFTIYGNGRAGLDIW